MIPLSPIDLERSYYQQLMGVMLSGVPSDDRTGVGTIRKQHAYFEWDGIALLRGKKQYPRSIVAEALWMLSGLTDLQTLEALGCGYWKQWAREDGSLGRIYGAQIRDFGKASKDENLQPIEVSGFDQLTEVCRQLREDPNSRRILISLWNPKDLEDMTLPPCHVLYQFCVVDGIVHMHVTQRSADAFIGVPADLTLFSIMLQLICFAVNMPAGRIHYTCNDFHVYSNHRGAVTEYGKRMSKLEDLYTPCFDWVGVTDTVSQWLRDNIGVGKPYRGIADMLETLCKAHINGENIFTFENYKPMGAIAVPVAK